MKSKFIYTHLGLGDAISCNGLVRKIIDPQQKYSLFCKHHNVPTVEFMYSDIPNLTILPVSNDGEAVRICNEKYMDKGEKTIKIGFEKMNQLLVSFNCKFDVAFYKQMNIPFEERWNSFYYNRSRLDKEINLFHRFQLKEEDEYVFIHHDPERKFRIDAKYFNTGYRIIQPIEGFTDNVFDYVYIIEHAKEVHCIDSSFLLMIDSLKNFEVPCFYHAYARHWIYTSWEKELFSPSMSDRWKRIDA